MGYVPAGRSLVLDIQLEPWEGYRGPPVPEGTDASQIPVLRRASEWRDYDPSLHYVNRSQEVRVQDLEWGYVGDQHRMWSHPAVPLTPGTSDHRGDLQEPG